MKSKQELLNDLTGFARLEEMYENSVNLIIQSILNGPKDPDPNTALILGDMAEEMRRFFGKDGRFEQFKAMIVDVWDSSYTTDELAALCNLYGENPSISQKMISVQQTIGQRAGVMAHQWMNEDDL